MTMLECQKYRKKPVVIEAIRYSGDNLAEVLAFTGRHPRFDEWFSSFDEYAAHVASDRQVFKILTLEGTMEASPGDWIIKGVKGEFYPCKPDIFDATYEPVFSTITPAEVGGLVDTLRSMSHDDNTRACVSVNSTVSNDLAKKLFDVLHAAPKAATALEAQAAELAAVKAERGAAREYAMQARLRENAAEDARVSAVSRASRTEAALAETRKALDGLLKQFEGDDCRYDHHGYCQAHFLQEADECCVKIARRVREGGQEDGNG